jgi:RNA-binding protein
MNPLSPKRRSELRAEAHKLSPLVIIGDKGLTDEVIKEIDRTLTAHELIKVRAATDEREARDAWLDTICERLQAYPVQQIGKVFVLYRENPEERKAPAAKPKARPEKPRGKVVSDRGNQRQRERDDAKRRALDLADMIRKGKIRPKEASAPVASPPETDEGSPELTPPSRPRSRTPSPRAESAPPRRRPRSSR